MSLGLKGKKWLKRIGIGVLYVIIVVFIGWPLMLYAIVVLNTASYGTVFILGVLIMKVIDLVFNETETPSYCCNWCGMEKYTEEAVEKHEEICEYNSKSVFYIG